MSTYFPSGKDLALKRKWLVIDAAGQTVGHLASEVASILTGKRNPQWTPFMDMGDNVIVINARRQYSRVQRSIKRSTGIALLSQWQKRSFGEYVR